MKVTPESTTKEYLKHLQEQQRNKVMAKEAELKNLGKRYEKQEKIIRQKGRQQLSAQEVENRKELLKIQDKGAKTLEKMQAQNKVRQFQLNNEHKNLLTQSQLRNQDLASNLSESYNQKIMKVAEINSETNDQVDYKIDEISRKATEQIEKERFSAGSTVLARHNEVQSKLDREEDKFNKMIDFQRKEFASTLQDNKKTQKTILAETQRNNRILLENTKQTQDHQLKFSKEFHKNKLKQEKESFENTLAQQVSVHREILKRVKNQFENEIKKYKAESATEKSVKQSKSIDPFYNVSLLSPRIVESPKEVAIHIEIPEYEANNLKVSVQKKEINLNLARHFEDRLESQDGSVNKSRRSEVISKKISLPYYLSDKNISKEYHDNVLTIRINKDV